MADDKILDLDTMSMVDKPAEKQLEIETKVEDVKDDNPDVEKKEVDEPEAKKEEDAGEDKGDSKEEEKELEGKSEEEIAAEKVEDEKKDEDEKEEVIEIDSYLKANYDIDNEEALRTTLAAAEQFAKDNEALTKEIAELKERKNEPVFASDDERKAFEFIKKFPVDKLNEGLQTFGRLVTMDLEKAEPRILLEEKFIIEHPELTREEALKKFGRDYTRKYSVKAEEFDNDADLKEEQEMRAIDMKSDAAKAKKFLEKQQEEFKAKPTDKKQDQKSEVNPVIETNVRANVAELDTYMKDFTEITFAPSDKKEEEFTYKLTKEQKDQVQAAIKNWIGNPSTYDKDGKIPGGYDVDEQSVKVAQLLFGDAMIEKAYKAGLNHGKIKRVDEISKVKPDRVGKTVDGKLPTGNEMDQFEKLAKSKALDRSRRPPVAH